MDDLSLLIDLHADGPRQGPGSDETTRQAITLAGLHEATGLRIADIGCGTGASTLVLAQELDAHVTAIDLAPAFLSRLDDSSHARGLADRVDTQAASMDDLSFDDQSLDAIWSEGAIYSMGFEEGVRAWRRFLKPGGILAVSDLTWFTQRRPRQLDDHWSAEYPAVATASAKMAVLEATGYTPIGYFTLPEACWLEGYYRPLQDRFAAFLDRHDHSAAANQLIKTEQEEIALYERFSNFVGYGFYVARRNDQRP